MQCVTRGPQAAKRSTDFAAADDGEGGCHDSVLASRFNIKSVHNFILMALTNGVYRDGRDLIVQFSETVLSIERVACVPAEMERWLEIHSENFTDGPVAQ
jgi:hypothetical protein